ncbi:protein-L-isoaspartate O-methyltransferase family protein [Nocardiopsis synnemataformans]|uniref:protein-L-isoaspartate O-methyltransferase family protein n=1 Tax=Nocardiopsis synnemataformans TaxID=61305 RepID=UPI003EBC6CC1
MTDTTTTPPAITAALARVDETHYRGTDKRAVRQTTPASVIERHLPLLDIQEGMRVLEIGTGSGYSTALLAELTGPHGAVVSVDVEADLITRATGLHHQAGYTTITSLAGDGYAGAPDHAPFDRLIAWTTPPHLPTAWIEQVRPGGIILAPLVCAPIAYSTAMARITVANDHTPGPTTLSRGQYVPMTTPALDRSRYATISRIIDGERSPSYISAPWIAATGTRGLAETVFTRMLHASHTEPVDVGWPEIEHFKLWAIAHEPAGLTMAHRGKETLVGITTSDHVGFVALFPETRLVADSATSPPLEHVRDLIQEWKEHGRPTIDTVGVHATPIDQGWTLTLAPAPRSVA